MKRTKKVAYSRDAIKKIEHLLIITAFRATWPQFKGVMGPPPWGVLAQKSDPEVKQLDNVEELIEDPNNPGTFITKK